MWLLAGWDRARRDKILAETQFATTGYYQDGKKINRPQFITDRINRNTGIQTSQGNKDIKDYSYKKLIVVANLPYYVTTPIINKLIIDNIMPSLMVLMVQKEVADRFCAKKSSKNYNSLSIFLQYHYDINPLFIVSNNCFIPKPKVDSCVVRFKLKDEKLPVNDINKFYKLIRDSFRFKRKNLKNNLSSYDLDKVNLILSKYGFDLTARAEELDLNIFVDIANNI